MWLRDPGKAILGWPALWGLPRLFATPAKKTRFRLKTAENTKWSRYICSISMGSLQRLTKNMITFENGWKYEMVSICNISQRALCNAWKKRFRVWKRLETQNGLYISNIYVSVTTENTLRTIHTQYMNKQICTTNILEQQVSSPQQLHHIHFINMSLYS